MPDTGGIQIEREGLGHAISDNTLAVPVNQRSYAWEEEHIVDLFQDLAGAIANDEQEYFLGSIVVTASENGVPEVADGQQRLATTTILLAAIRDHFYTHSDSEAAKEVERQYLQSINMRTRETVPKLRLNNYDNDYFKKRVLSRPDDAQRKVECTKESHRKIDRAARLAAKHVGEIIKPYNEADRTERLLDWVEFIRDKARVIWVTVPDDQNAFIIFETLNDRGLSLSIADLLKNYLFGRAGDRLDEAQQRWSAMAGALETVSRDDITVTYIRHLWASMHGPTRERDLYASIKKSIKSKQSAIDLANALGEEANLYASIINPDSHIWNRYGSGTRKHLAIFNTFQAEQVRPLLLTIVKHFSVPETKKAVKLLVCWSVRFLIVGGGGGGTMERNYSLRAMEVREGIISTASELAKAMSSVVPGDAAFEAGFATARVSQAHLARYYLRALELQTKGDPEPELVPNTEEDVVNLEHILPQHPAGEWPDFDPDTAAAYYKRIGNMVLLQARANAAIGRDSFRDKKQYFKKSAFILTSEVARRSTWGVDEINDRQKKLAAIAVKTWPVSI
jgi:hypothetical protein